MIEWDITEYNVLIVGIYGCVRCNRIWSVTWIYDHQDNLGVPDTMEDDLTVKFIPMMVEINSD